MDGAPPSPHHQHISADRGGVAAGRDAHVHQDLWFMYRPCPSCELRWITAEVRICGACKRRRRTTRAALVLVAAVIGFCVCLGIAVACDLRDGRLDYWALDVAGACALFGGGYCAWSRCVTPRHLRRARRYVKKLWGGGNCLLHNRCGVIALQTTWFSNGENRR